MEWLPARRAGGVILAALGVASLLVVVALASRPETSGGLPRLGETPARVVLDVASYLLLVTALLMLLLLVWVLWPRPGEELPPLPRRRRRPLSVALSTALAIVLIAWLRSRHLIELPELSPASPGAQGGAGAAGRAAGASAAGTGGPDWLAAGIVAGLLAAAAVLVWRALRPPSPRDPRRALAAVRELLDDAIDDVLAEADPRRAVIAAWARLERLLARSGVARRDSEAPLEYATRASAAVGVASVSFERLADLFEWARFSQHEVTPAMRDEALDGLVAARDGLRLVA